MSIQIGDTVVMKSQVIRQSNHSEFSRAFKGVVVAIVGRTADVETVNGVRSIPLANLSSVKAVKDARTQTSSLLIVE